MDLFSPTEAELALDARMKAVLGQDIKDRAARHARIERRREERVAFREKYDKVFLPPPNPEKEKQRIAATIMQLQIALNGGTYGPPKLQMRSPGPNAFNPNVDSDLHPRLQPLVYQPPSPPKPGQKARPYVRRETFTAPQPIPDPHWLLHHMQRQNASSYTLWWLMPEHARAQMTYSTPKYEEIDDVYQSMLPFGTIYAGSTRRARTDTMVPRSQFVAPNLNPDLQYGGEVKRGKQKVTFKELRQEPEEDDSDDGSSTVVEAAPPSPNSRISGCAVI